MMVHPTESEATATALLTAWRALKVLDVSSLLEFIAEKAYDPKAADQARAAIAEIEANVSPWLLLQMLPTYTKVRIVVDGLEREGQTRETNMRGDTRITTTMGMEWSISRHTVIDSFEVLS